LVKRMVKISIARLLLAGAGLLATGMFASTVAAAAQLSTDARTAVPHDVQQLVVIDYRAMQNSQPAMELRGRVMPPELKQFDDALTKSGLNENHDVEQLAFALFRPFPLAGEKATEGESVPRTAGEMDELKRKLDDMQKRIDRLTTKEPD